MKILVTAPLTPEDLAELKTIFDEVDYRPWRETNKWLTAEEMLALLKETKPDALITEMDKVDASVIEGYHDLKFIGDCRGTPVNVDRATASKYKIPMIYTPGRNAETVSELLVGCLICFLRKIPQAVRWTRAGNWKKDGQSAYTLFQGREVYGKRIGLVGLGAVGRITAKILSSMNAEIVYYDPYVESTPEGYRKVGLEELFETSDIVSIHLPVLDSTRGMINRDLMKKMKPDAVFVNSSRSAVIDSKALLEILENGEIGGAVLDVYDTEPAEGDDAKFLTMDNVLATPHLYGAAPEVAVHQSRIMLDNVKKVLAGEDLRRILWNKEILDD